MTIDTRGLHVDKVYTKEERNKLEPQLDKLTDKDIKKLAKFINRDIGNANTAYLGKLYLNESKEKNGKHLIDDLISKLPEDKKSILEKKGFVKNDKLKHPETGSKQVAVIQSVLGVEVDGKYGQKTFKAVIEFQKSHGLKIDAIVGEETLKAIIKDLGGEEKKDTEINNTGKKVDKPKGNVSKTGGNVIPGTVDISGKNKADKKEDDSKAKTDNKTTKPNYQGDSDKVCKTDKPDYNGKTSTKKVETAKGKEDNEGNVENNKIKALEEKYDVKIEKTDEGMYVVNDKDGKYISTFESIDDVEKKLKTMEEGKKKTALEEKYDVKIEKTDKGMYLVYDQEGKFLRNFDNIDKIDEGISKVLLDKYEQLGYSLQSEGKIYQAIDAYKTALEYAKADKDKIWLNAIIGDLYHSKGDYEEAIGAYKKALKLSPNNEYIKKQLAESYVKLGAGYVESKQYENAKYAYKQALKYVKDENEKKKIQGYMNRAKLAETVEKAYEENVKDKKNK